MAKSKKKYFKASVFVVAGAVLLISYLVVISGHQSFFLRVNNYKIILENAGGLFIGSYVTINGMRAGNVNNISLEEGKVLVRLGIRKRFSNFINQSSTAVPKTKGILGDKYVAIYTTADAPALPNGSFINTDFEENKKSAAQKEDLLDNVSLLIQEMTVFVSQLNKGEDKNFAKELTRISQQTQKLLSDKNNNNVKEILIHLKSILKKIDKGDGTLGAIVNDRELHEKAISFLGAKPYSNILKYIFSNSSSKKKSKNEDEDF